MLTSSVFWFMVIVIAVLVGIIFNISIDNWRAKQFNSALTELITRTLKRRNELELENQKMRFALEVFADHNAWLYRKEIPYPMFDTHNESIPIQDPIKFAHEALGTKPKYLEDK